MRLEVSLKGNLTTSTKFSKIVKKCLIKIFLRRNLNYIAYDYLCPDMGVTGKAIYLGLQFYLCFHGICTYNHN